MHTTSIQMRKFRQCKDIQELRDCPKSALNQNKSLKTETSVDLRKEICLMLRHDGVGLWRLVAVGYKKFTQYLRGRLASCLGTGPTRTKRDAMVAGRDRAFIRQIYLFSPTASLKAF
jgi:hypothetical protein